MSFLNIKNPHERAETVADYLATFRRIKQRNLQERARDFYIAKDNEKTAEPIVKSAKTSTIAITNELKPIKDEMHDLNDKMQTIMNRRRRRKTSDAGEDETAAEEKKKKTEESSMEEEEEEDSGNNNNIYTQIMERVEAGKIDNYFGIVERRDENGYYMGNMRIELKKNNNIVAAGVTFPGTTGLWSLIMLKIPDVDDYGWEDLESYHRLVELTNVMEHPNNQKRNSKPRSTRKWKEILAKFDETPSSSSRKGNSIEFLPGDKKGLQTKFAYLLGEFRAGNTSATRNQIVAVSDELLRRKVISRREYQTVNDYIQQQR